ncbi:protein takeout [Drosophila innubila]|uniref:protein takeout n=1 Tax=Drosophila innubila TaxID=198719 RepID=UPI00148DD22D|nr:protein takeout [Drosophila innubila]
MDRKALSLLLISSLYCISSLVHATDLPAGITKCSITDEKCLKNSMNYVLKNHAKTGIKQLGLVPLDPLHVKKFSLGKNPKSPVSIDLTFSNADLLGLGEAQVKKVSPFTRDLSQDIEFDMVSPKIALKGPYSIEGKVLILPIHGSGKAEIILEQCKVHANVKLKGVSKGQHQTYAEVVDVKLNLDPSHVSYRFTGLFNGQKAPSDTFHALVNENWREIFTELKEDICTATGLIFKSILNNTLRKRPIEQLFTDI